MTKHKRITVGPCHKTNNRYGEQRVFLIVTEERLKEFVQLKSKRKVILHCLKCKTYIYNCQELTLIQTYFFYLSYSTYAEKINTAIVPYLGPSKNKKKQMNTL